MPRAKTSQKVAPETHTANPLATALVNAAKECANPSVAELLSDLAANGKEHAVRVANDSQQQQEQK